MRPPGIARWLLKATLEKDERDDVVANLDELYRARRLALGATRGDIIRQEIRTGLKMTALGMGIGLLAAVGVSTLLSSLLFEASPFDLPVFAGTAAMLAAIAFLGVGIPALRAARMDPLVAIRAVD